MRSTTLRISRGPSLRFTGELIASDEWEANNGRTIRIEFWQTAGGNLIGVRYSKGDWDENWSVSEAVVIDAADDIQAQRFALLDWFQWEMRARSLAKGLKWNLTREVD